ncbi:MAG: N-6 DNA methylase, partial [Desulfosarcina sp.]|nr:N-6 DNA methylase [Desulfosarcina sp.]
LWNKFWAGGIANPLTAIEQITYLLFMKRLDDLDLKQQADAEFTGDAFISRFSGNWVPSEHRDKSKKDQKPFEMKKNTLRWSEFKRMHAEEMLTHVQSKVFPFLKDINGQTSNFSHHMKNAVFLIPKPSLMVEAVKTIDEIFEEMEKDSKEKGQAFQDIQGDVYEYLLSEIATAGKNGQFRTPRHIIKLMAELVHPQLGHRIADPACGTGGFLLGAYQYVVTRLALKKGAKDLQPDDDGFKRTSVSAGLTEKAKKILNESLWGYDIDSTMVRLGLMNLMMHGIDEPHIDYKDTLSKSFNVKTTKTELLFVETIYGLLKKGGTAGIIVPQGVLFGAAKAFVAARKILVDSCDLKAVITMPSGVFKPYAGVSTAILIFTKVYDKEDKVTEPATEHVWFYDMKDDGYSLDDKRNKLEGYGDLQDIAAKFKKRNPKKDTDRTQKCFAVPRKEIVDEKYDLSWSRYHEDVFEEIEYEKPGVILEKLLVSEMGEGFDEKTLAGIQGGVVKELLELKGMVG